MNIRKSIRIALDKKAPKGSSERVWLAAELGVTRQRVDGLIRQNRINSDMIKRLANAFGMKASAFIKLGED